MEKSAHVDTFARDNLPPPGEWPEILDSPDTRYPARFNCAVELVDANVARGMGERVALRWRQDGKPASMTYDVHFNDPDRFILGVFAGICASDRTKR